MTTSRQAALPAHSPLSLRDSGLGQQADRLEELLHETLAIYNLAICNVPLLGCGASLCGGTL